MPKILPFDVSMRTAVRVPQLAEQLVEVPTIISYSSLQRTVEHYVNIPVPGVGGPSSGLQGFSGQSSTALPSSKKRISERIVEQIVDLFQVDVFMVLSQDRVHLLHTLQLVMKNAQMSLVKGVSHFSQK